MPKFTIELSQVEFDALEVQATCERRTIRAQAEYCVVQSLRVGKIKEAARTGDLINVDVLCDTDPLFIGELTSDPAP